MHLFFKRNVDSLFIYFTFQLLQWSFQWLMSTIIQEKKIYCRKKTLHIKRRIRKNSHRFNYNFWKSFFKFLKFVFFDYRFLLFTALCYSITPLRNSYLLLHSYPPLVNRFCFLFWLLTKQKKKNSEDWKLGILHWILVWLIVVQRL